MSVLGFIVSNMGSRARAAPGGPAQRGTAGGDSSDRDDPRPCIDALTVELTAMLSRLGVLAAAPGPGSDALRIDRIAVLERLRGAPTQIRPHRRGGPTDYPNGRGVCARGNFVREMPGWQTDLIHDGLSDQPHTVRTTTPTGHSYTSTAGPAP
jgi:hypothetical protein